MSSHLPWHTFLQCIHVNIQIRQLLCFRGRPSAKKCTVVTARNMPGHWKRQPVCVLVQEMERTGSHGQGTCLPSPRSCPAGHAVLGHTRACVIRKVCTCPIAQPQPSRVAHALLLFNKSLCAHAWTSLASKACLCMKILRHARGLANALAPPLITCQPAL